MKIAIIRSSLHKGSGQAVHIQELSRQLIKLGNEGRIFSRRIENPVLSTIGTELKFPLDNVPFLRHAGFACKCLAAITDYDVVHTQYQSEIIAGNWLHKFKKLPHVFTYHGFAPVRMWRNPFQKLKMIDHRIEAYFLIRRELDRIIVVSHFLKRELINWYHLNPDLIRVIHNGVDIYRFNPNVKGGRVREAYSVGDAPLVTFIGRLAPYKGPQFLLEAIPQVLQEVPDTRFMFVGQARFDVPRVSYILQNQKIRKAVVFTGYVDDELLPEFYASCDVFCYPSLFEGFGLTPAEAQAAGKPVVAFKTCALPEVVQDGVTGLLVPPRDSSSLAKAIVRLLRDTELRKRMGTQAGIDAKRKFSWENAARNTIAVYKEALEVHKLHR